MPNVITLVKRCFDQIKCMVTKIIISILILFNLLSFCQSVYYYYVTFCVFCVSLCSFLCHMFFHSLHFIFTCLGYPHNYNQQCFVFLFSRYAGWTPCFGKSKLKTKTIFSVFLFCYLSVFLSFCLSVLLFFCFSDFCLSVPK